MIFTQNYSLCCICCCNCSLTILYTSHPFVILYHKSIHIPSVFPPYPAIHIHLSISTKGSSIPILQSSSFTNPRPPVITDHLFTHPNPAYILQPHPSVIRYCTYNHSPSVCHPYNVNVIKSINHFWGHLFSFSYLIFIKKTCLPATEIPIRFWCLNIPTL